ncbi:Glycogen synthase [Gemmata obscuriglobus]|uniref:Glycosyltransferase family 4 protein n=1 Tax=Gemmata obscuriglobus TaxID=114 RepID=A0A2Z3H2U2_9BACT|nr:glycosyltransferase [Gemmata obscuriglobus]AWM40078.1 glycosyltransferase family 4 protein [Gemmata obscuriglobus]QEG26757.1 Glycogen synthase [Gemmata obscuriglobus]VTS02561.1 group 1 glycosyl transferase : Glycosyl transferase group 1 OS=Nostoc sp. PCC 7107 GN=Nos7107_0151 PE=4 SV=1: Glyco_transf_4: Glycos_transf_1 [Gemmata obscuriglobus UQM 2246]
MRVLLTADPEIPVPPLTYGGIERIVADLAAGLRERGHAVGLAAHRGSTAPVDAFFPWPGAASQNLRDTVRNTRALARAVNAFRPDVVHSFSRLMYLLPLLPGRLPKVMSYQRNPSLRTTRWAQRLAGRTLRFTGCSGYICAIGRRAGGTWDAVPNFVDLTKYTFRASVPADAPFVFLSRVEHIKGAHVAIAVAKRAGRPLVIAGNHASDDTPNGRYWREQIQPHLGRNGIEYVGPVNDAQKNELLGRAAAMLVPIQWNEPFGIVFAEALACGTPVISCPRGALPEIIRNGTEGFLAETEEALAVASRRVGEIDRAACRARAESAFSAGRVISRYERLYTEAARGGPRTRSLTGQVT